MIRFKLFVIFVGFIFCVTKISIAQVVSNQATQSPSGAQEAEVELYAKSPPLDLNLTQLEYPYPVHFFDTQLGGVKVKMAYMDVMPVGKPRGNVILFHGKNFSSDYWGSTIKDLTQAGYRVIAPDQIGFGKSSKPEVAYHFDDLCANTFQLLKHLHVRQVNVVANSMGGMVGVRFVRLYPKTVRRLVLENPIGLEDYSKIGRAHV